MPNQTQVNVTPICLAIITMTWKKPANFLSTEVVVETPITLLL
ncbi:unnamed protein product [Larinioides sclopetarius]|uniref:Uncharacterized protein n=1 Tax=Larinioides sclopetarius TaxID=280406 RepID=A0AAV2BS40_9ARAC